MAKTHVLTQARQAKLIADIRKLIEKGRARAEGAAKREMVRTYWLIGERIDEEALTDHAGYSEAVLRDAAEELGMDYSTLTRCVTFFRTHGIAPGSNSLTWSHYKYLLPIQDKQRREWYEQLAQEEGLNRDQLAAAIKRDLYTERNKRKGAKARAPKLKRPTEPTYVYKAEVKRVVDADTLILMIDLGFQVFKEQRVRLAGINAPALDEPGGKEAYRYVRDVFYSLTGQNKEETFQKGRYLNQELLDKGLARML